MEHINKATVQGRLERAIELRTTSGGKQVAELRIATERSWNGANGSGGAVDYHTVVAWEELAARCADLTEGDVVCVEGRLQTRSWEDNRYEGVKHYRTEIIAATITLVATPVGDDTGDA